MEDGQEEEDDLGLLAKLLREDEDSKGSSKAARVLSILRGLDEHDDDAEEEEQEPPAAPVPVVPFPRPHTFNGNDLFRSLQLMDFESVRALLEHDPELMGTRDEEDTQPLGVAIAARFDRAVKLLLHLGCPLEEVDKRGYSGLHLAVEAFVDMPFLLRYLLQYRGLDVNAPAVLDGMAPIHLSPDERCLKLLLGCGADPSLRDGQGDDVLTRLERTWPKAGKAKKKARFLLARLSSYQSYVLWKLRFLTHMYSYSSSASASALLEATRAKTLDVRLDAHTELVDLQKDEEEAAGIMCRTEVPGQVYSFVENGCLYLARSRSTSPNYGPSPSPSPPLHEGVLDEGGGGGGKEGSNPSPPPSFPLCPLSVLKEAKADIFLVGGGPTATTGNKGGGGEKQDAQQLEDQEWVLLPPLPRVAIHCSEKEEEERNMAAAVLHYVVHKVVDERVMDVLQAMLWTSGGAGNGGKRESR